MRKKIVAGNWKMNKTLNQGELLTKSIISELEPNNQVKVILIPPFTHISKMVELAKETEVSIGSQNNNENESGAFTGEVSSIMLADIGTEYGLVGHSERRLYFKESNEQLLAKTISLLNHNIIPIFCCGESLEERKGNIHFKTVLSQLEPVFSLPEVEFNKIVIAYEPVWAIGTGETASSDQAQEMHSFIRNEISKNYSTTIGESTSILYGGSCKPSNAKELFSMKDVDGGLIGGAALKAQDFVSIIKSF